MEEEIQKKIKELENGLNIDQQYLQKAMNAAEQTKTNIIAKQGAIQCLRDLTTAKQEPVAKEQVPKESKPEKAGKDKKKNN